MVCVENVINVADLIKRKYDIEVKELTLNRTTGEVKRMEE